MKYCIGFLVLYIFLSSCSSPTTAKLPLLGEPVITNNGDTVYPVIRPFSFIDQDSTIVTDKSFDNKIYVADFIFLSCPTICPKMTTEMKKVYDRYRSEPDILFLSHTIDPENDSITLLKKYARSLEADSNKWFFVSGARDSIYHIAEKSYFAVAYADSTAPGGYVHSGGLLLVDKNKHIRGVYDGTDEQETERLIKDIETLLKEQF